MNQNLLNIKKMNELCEQVEKAVDHYEPLDNIHITIWDQPNRKTVWETQIGVKVQKAGIMHNALDGKHDLKSSKISLDFFFDVVRQITVWGVHKT